MGVTMALLILTSLAVAALPSSSLPQLPLASHQPLVAQETEVAEKYVEAGDSVGDDVEKNYAKYVKLCTSLGIAPITLGSGYTAPYTNNVGSYYGNRYPSYSGYTTGYTGFPSNAYPSGYGYYRGNAVGRSKAIETTEDTTEEDAENDYAEYLKLCSTLGIPSIPLSPSYSSPYTNYGGYGGSSNYGYGYAGSSGYNGYNGYSGNSGYGGYPSYPYTASYVNPVYYRGNAAGRSTETETTEDSTKEADDEYLKLCSTLGLPSSPLSSGYSSPSPYTSYGGPSNYGFGGSSNNGHPSYGSYNSGYAYPVSSSSSSSNYGYGYPGSGGYNNGYNNGYQAYRNPSNSGSRYPYGR